MIMPVVLPYQNPVSVTQVNQVAWLNFQKRQGYLSQPMTINRSKLIIYFATGDSVLKDHEKKKITGFIEQNARCLSIVGSSSMSGHAHYNLRLSKRRANHVAAFTKQQRNRHAICCVSGKGESPYSPPWQAQSVTIKFSRSC